MDVVLFSDVSQQSAIIAGMKYTEFPGKSSGPHRLKTEIRNAGFTCQVIDLFFYFTEEELIHLCEKIISKKTLVVGFSTTFWLRNNFLNNERFKKFKIVYDHVRKLNGPKIVFGGPSSIEFSRMFPANKTFSGYAEQDFINYLFKLIGKEENHQFDFNHSQIVYQKNDFMNYEESPVIEISRGCIFKCKFCAFPLNGKSKFDYVKDKEVLKEELIRNYETHGMTIYTFSDDTFNDSTYKLEYLHDIFMSLPFKIKFTSYIRLDLLNAHREQISLLRNMGLFGAFFGVETLNYEAAKTIGKGMSPEKIKDFLYELKSEHWKDDVNISIGLITGLPYETKKSFQETMDWILNKEYCLINKITVLPLGVTNPLYDKNPFKSQFQLDAKKYGFYWTDKGSHAWNNSIHEIKSWDEAAMMATQLLNAIESVNKHTRENFSLPRIANVARFANDPKTFDEIFYMPVKDFITWLNKNHSSMVKGYVNNYKSKVLNL